MTEIWDIELDGFDELMRDLTSRYPDVVADEMYKAMEKSLAVFHQAVTVETPVNTGALRAAMTTDIVSSPVSLVGSVMNPLIYAWPVERGRQPGRMPPVSAIELWVVRKLGIQSPESRGVAYVIARAIGKRGTAGAGMFWKGFQNALPRVEQLWDVLVDNIVKRLG